LRWQDLPADELEIVLSDFGSNAEHAASIAALAEEFRATVTRAEEFGDWNRSRALNLGIQASTGTHMFCTDADMIFAPSFVPALLAVHARNAKALVVCACTDMPKTVPERDYALEDFERLRSAGRVRKSNGTGACQSANREFFFAARGYDESFVHWGSEDTDMRDRALASGLEMVSVSDQTAMLHQWHPTSRYSRLLQNRKNAIHLFFTRKQIIKNLDKWGNQR
jgi:hypothetical protein